MAYPCATWISFMRCMESILNQDSYSEAAVQVQLLRPHSVTLCCHCCCRCSTPHTVVYAAAAEHSQIKVQGDQCEGFAVSLEPLLRRWAQLNPSAQLSLSHLLPLPGVPLSFQPGEHLSHFLDGADPSATREHGCSTSWSQWLTPRLAAMNIPSHASGKTLQQWLNDTV